LGQCFTGFYFVLIGTLRPHNSQTVLICVFGDEEQNAALKEPDVVLYSFNALYTVRSESRCALRLRYVDLVVSIEVAVAVVSLYSGVKQRLKCNTGKVCNCLIMFLLTVVLSIEERTDARGHHFQDLVSLHSDFPNGL
jgi:archaellum biogenesis protein FlaJ (TadC family)